MNHEETFISERKFSPLPFLLLSFIKILIIYFTRIESNVSPFFFKSFQILSNPWWYFDNRFWNVDPSQLVTRRVWTLNVINWLKFCPSFRKFSSSHCVSTSWLLFTYFSSKRYRSALRMEFEGMKTVWEMIDESRVDESSIFNFEKFNKMIFALDLEKEKKESSEINL